MTCALTDSVQEHQLESRKRLLLASLVFLAILGLLAVEYLPLAEEDKTELKISWPITDALVNKIDQWVIRGPSEKVRLEKKQEGWLISEPVKTQVNPEKVGNFLKQLHEVSPKKEVRHLEPGVTTGLEEPQFVIQGYSGPKDQVFGCGWENPINPNKRFMPLSPGREVRRYAMHCRDLWFFD